MRSWQFCYKVACIDDKFSKPVVLYRGKNKINKFIATVLKDYDYCKRMIKNFLTRIQLCLKNMKKDFSHVINAAYGKNCSIQEITKQDTIVI